MKIAIMIMSTNSQPSLRNVDAFENTVVKYYNENKDSFKHKYDFYVYYSNNMDRDVYTMKNGYAPDITRKDNGVYEICIAEKESIYRTFEKTYYAFETISKNDYDLFVRINISLWLNMRLLDAVADQFKEEYVYCNAINSHLNGNSIYVNDLYPRGDMYIFGKRTMEGIIENGNKYLYCDSNLKNRIGVEHVDDCMIGICLIDTYGKDYYKHIIQLRYVFAPRDSIYSNGNILDEYSIGFRVKTTPAGLQSGYSWDDNKYRLKDVNKMYELQKYFNDNVSGYDGTKLEYLFPLESSERPTLLVQASNQKIKDIFWRVLSNKRK